MRKSKLPDFIIAGAPRSGTTWLYHLLDRLPEVYLAKPVAPEPKFFLVDDLYNRGMDYYSERWFGEVPEGVLCGEKSTNYLESPTVAARIQSALPKVKLVFMLRDPVSRAYSNFLWSRKNGIETETDFSAALSMEDERTKDLPEKLKYAKPFSYFARGLYAELLRPYFKAFPREQILVLEYEAISKDPDSISRKLSSFLGLSVPPSGRDLGVINSSDATEEAPIEAAELLRERYREPNARLFGLLNEKFEAWS